MPARSVSISKFLARILRHRPEAAGLRLDRHGWASVEEVLEAISRKFGTFNFEQLVELVATNDKRRFGLSDDGSRIRAAQGHSIAVDLQLEPKKPPPLLYHGTKSSSLGSIMQTGLVRGRRHHVHLSADAETALKVGSRRSGEAIVLLVRSADMAEHDFFLSENGVWLTGNVPPQFLSVSGGQMGQAAGLQQLKHLGVLSAPVEQQAESHCPKS